MSLRKTEAIGDVRYTSCGDARSSLKHVLQMPPIVRRRFFHFLLGIDAIAWMFLAPTELDCCDVLWRDESLDESHARQIGPATEPDVAVRHISQREWAAILIPKQVAVRGDRQRS